MIERLTNIENRYNEINEELMKPEIISNIKETLKLTKEQAGLKDAYEAFQNYKKLFMGGCKKEFKIFRLCSKK